MNSVNQKRKRCPEGGFMRSGIKLPICYENALPSPERPYTDWSVRYVLMCDYLDEIDVGDLTHLKELIHLCEIETEWCSFDKRLVGFDIINQKYHYDSEGCVYETTNDVNAKVDMLWAYLDKLAATSETFVQLEYNTILEREGK